ncbi:hypothetical protein FSP39_022978 [Pinctada imbricata]|uniref:Uncharacterized protein n=1 Tax=Pinctada imbricata TaxID=66713 RepID=A0AA88YXS4_PINIB|nr:hypothetical protein FSP39_022978 [Pinctada imbricata]
MAGPEDRDSLSKQKRGFKRKLSCDSESGSSSISSSVNSTDNASSSCSDHSEKLPIRTCDWKQTSLDVIRMYPEFSHDSPCEILKRSLKRLWGEEMYQHYSKEIKSSRGNLYFQEIKSFILELSDCLLNRSHIDNVTITSIYDMKASIRELMKRKNINITAEALELWGKDWRCLMKSAAVRFGIQLEHMLSSKLKTDRYKEGMFQTLFMYFLDMCNLTAFGFTNIGSKNVQIKRAQVTSIPDILIMDSRIHCIAEEEVTAVVEVKKDYGKQDVTIANLTRCGKRSPGYYADECRNVSSDLICQHGGDLLAYLPDSIFGSKGIFGMIVQDTEVTVTFLDAESGYFEAVQTLFEEKRCSSKINLSGEYNFLSKDDRRELVGFLAELAFLQRLKKIDTHMELFQSCSM